MGVSLLFPCKFLSQNTVPQFPLAVSLFLQLGKTPDHSDRLCVNAVCTGALKELCPLALTRPLAGGGVAVPPGPRGRCLWSPHPQRSTAGGRGATWREVGGSVGPHPSPQPPSYLPPGPGPRAGAREGSCPPAWEALGRPTWALERGVGSALTSALHPGRLASPAQGSRATPLDSRGHSGHRTLLCDLVSKVPAALGRRTAALDAQPLLGLSGSEDRGRAQENLHVCRQRVSFP